MRLHPAIRKWNIVVSCYDYNVSRTSLQIIIILNEKAQDAVGLESWGSLDSKALIKLEKTREESKSSAAGERKELMLKSRSL